MTMPHTNTASHLVHLEHSQTYEHTSNRAFGAHPIQILRQPVNSRKPTCILVPIRTCWNGAKAKASFRTGTRMDFGTGSGPGMNTAVGSAEWALESVGRN